MAFFSKGYPLPKAKEYVALRKPFILNDLEMQEVSDFQILCAHCSTNTLATIKSHFFGIFPLFMSTQLLQDRRKVYDLLEASLAQ